MLDRLKVLFSPEELLEGDVGIEREGLRVNAKGELALTKHPDIFENKLFHPYITTDFSESQLELITPSLSTSDKVYNYLNTLYDIASMDIGDEYIWPYSMPCDIPADKDIPIAEYKDCEVCNEARLYREELFHKYGGKRQLISGLHYNFSFKEYFIERLYEDYKNKHDNIAIDTKEINDGSILSYREFKDSVYLKISRNYLRYRWLPIYLLGATPIVHNTYSSECEMDLEAVDKESFTQTGVVSYRNSECGYKNEVALYPDYTSVEAYIDSINKFVESGAINSYKELYSQIRPKAKDSTNLLESLSKDGILYIEVRSIDNNPFEKAGISLSDLEFMHLFMLYLLIKDEDELNQTEWQKEADNNQNTIAMNGLEEIDLSKGGEPISKTEWALEILNEIAGINNELNLNKQNIVSEMIDKVKDASLTYAYKISEFAREKGYLNSGLILSNTYKDLAYANRYRVYGYEDMELSTQILMREAIRRGITVEVIDRADNFILLKAGNHVEYVKQATKTSKDSYITMLIMENKIVTKKVLEKEGVYVPKGIELTKNDNLEFAVTKYINKPIVVKPKSTNFGKGISIFTKGAEAKDILKALEIGFLHDDTVLIEEFIGGKEYRFLVIGDKVEGILHRVPANVIGDGIHTIEELTNIKNQDTLRGEGYKSPLEKIKLDESSLLFLEQNGLDFKYIPKLDETVYLRENSNISTGGDSIDYTDDIPQKFKDIAVKAAKSVEAKFCGVDMMLENYDDEDSSYAIIELNFNPAIHIHSYPYKGKERPIAEKVLAVLGFDRELIINCDKY